MMEPNRFETHPSMLLAGIRRFHEMKNAAATIPAQWQDFASALHDIPDQTTPVTYGVICQGDPEKGTMEYMCAVEVKSFDRLPEHIGRMRVPPAHYAVFLHNDGVTTISQTWEYIFTTWLPISGKVASQTPDFEKYGAGFDPQTGMGPIEIWFPIEK